MKIAFTGTHSTGKTTLLNELKKVHNFEGFTFVEEITRTLKKQGYVINEMGGDETQQMVMDSHIKAINFENSILDRCALDGIVYTHYLFNNNQVSDEVFQSAFQTFLKLIWKYDIILHLKPEFDIVEDGVRSSNKEFQNEIDVLFDKYIDLFNIKTYRLSGSVEERLEQIKEIVNG